MITETTDTSGEQVLAACGAAVAAAQPGGLRWRIGNNLISKTLEWRPNGGFGLVALENRSTGHTWRADGATGVSAGGEFALSWNDKPHSARQATALRGVRAQMEDDAVTLQFDLLLAGELEITLHYRVHTGAAVIEQWVVVTPSQAGWLRQVAPLTVSVADLPSPMLHWVRGLQGHGWHMPPDGPYPAFQLCEAPLGAVTLASGLRSTWHEIAWFALDSSSVAASSESAGRGGGEGLFVGLLYSGRWSAQAQAGGAQEVNLDVFTEGYAAPLAAGESWTSPASFIGVYCGDLDAAAHVQHTYLRTAVLPPTPEDFPWVQYNTWFAHLVDIDETILRREAAMAARLGCEVFVIDAGWWEPSRRTSDNFTTGLGRWQPSAEKFPSGLATFADYVRSLGMRFGIWVEPERVDMRQPAAWRLDWLARHHDAIISPPWPPDTVSGWLCFGQPDVQAWAIEWISELVAAVGADWLKWDSNWWGVCTCADHGHSPTDGEFHQVQGVHRVLAELRRRFPNLMIENCAGGGTRTDFAMLSNTHATWLHDASTPSRRVRFHLAGANYLFPPEVCNTFVIDADDEPLTNPQTPRADLDTLARSRMLGAFGVSARLPEWTDAALAAVQAAIAQYKALRPLLKHGQFHHLLPQTAYECPDLAPHGQWEAYAVFDPNAQQGALWAFREPDGAPTRLLHLRGLAADAVYELFDVDTAQTTTATGAHWMNGGLSVDLSRRTSALILIRPAAAPSKGQP
jgi:alpha-galactosidase